MNERAFQILQSLGLRMPRVFSIDEAATARPDSTFYLRYAKKRRRANQVLTHADLTARLDEVRHELARGDLIQIEATYDTVIGGAVLLRRTFGYTEFVKGHTIALLRRGLCGCRCAFDYTGNVFTRRVFQGWAAKQNGQYTWLPTTGLSDRDCAAIIEGLQSLIHPVASPVLLEWMYTSSGEFIFCDARDDELDDFGEVLTKLSTNESVVVKDRLLDATHYQIDGFDVDFAEAPLDGIDLQAWNGALLSHFVTRRRSRQVRVELLGVRYARD